MADVTLTYKGTTIAELNDSGSKTIRTAGKYCEADIGVEYVKPSSGGLRYVVETKALASATGSITLDRAFENFILLAYLTTPPTSYPANNYAVAHMTAYVDGDFYLPTKTTAVKSQSGTSFQGNCVSPSKFSVSETSINWSPYTTNFGVVGDWTFVQIEILDNFGMYSWRKVAEDIAGGAS